MCVFFQPKPFGIRETSACPSKTDESTRIIRIIYLKIFVGVLLIPLCQFTVFYHYFILIFQFVSDNGFILESTYSQ